MLANTRPLQIAFTFMPRAASGSCKALGAILHMGIVPVPWRSFISKALGLEREESPKPHYPEVVAAMHPDHVCVMFLSSSQWMLPGSSVQP